MKYRSLSTADVKPLYQTFKAAFSDNFVKLQPSEREFIYRISKKIKVENDISAGAFDGEEMIGFILHSSNVYQGIPTAYNGGTGVLPGFRNQSIAEEIYAHLIPKIQSRFLARILLEVVEQNDYAVKLYEKIGFQFKRRMLCFKQLHKIDFLKDSSNTEEATIEELDFSFADFEPSFIDHEAHLKGSDERTLVCKIDGAIAGFIIFQPHLGRISQLAVNTPCRGNNVGRSLIYGAQKYTDKKMTIMNIPEDQHHFHKFLKRCGFENQVNQFEMELIT
ncbi:MAG: GNAT family N-acetyltransferase [Bacteroidota bacterium]